MSGYSFGNSPAFRGCLKNRNHRLFLQETAFAASKIRGIQKVFLCFFLADARSLRKIRQFLYFQTGPNLFHIHFHPFLFSNYIYVISISQVLALIPNLLDRRIKIPRDAPLWRGVQSWSRPHGCRIGFVQAGNWPECLHLHQHHAKQHSLFLTHRFFFSRKTGLQIATGRPRLRTRIHNHSTPSEWVFCRPAALKNLAIHKVLSAFFRLAGQQNPSPIRHPLIMNTGS